MMGIINNKINVTFVSLLRTVCNNAKYMRHALIHTVYNSILSCPNIIIIFFFMSIYENNEMRLMSFGSTGDRLNGIPLSG